MAFTDGQLVTADDLNDFSVTTVTTSGNVAVGGTLAVTGTQTLTGNTSMSGNVIVAGTLRVDNNATVGDASTDTHTVNGNTTFVNGLLLTGVISPSQLTGDVNDYAPTDFATASVLRLSSDASRTITGIAGGASGRTIVIVNVGSNDITLANESASSTAANRITSSGTALSAGRFTILWYDGTSSRWRSLA